jgi:hypothetical protein
MALVDKDPSVTSIGWDGEVTFLIGTPSAMLTSTVIDMRLVSIFVEVVRKGPG